MYSGVPTKNKKKKGNKAYKFTIWISENSKIKLHYVFKI